MSGARRLASGNTSKPEAGTFALLAIVLSAVSLVAAYVPARRALAVDPVVALRAE